MWSSPFLCYLVPLRPLYIQIKFNNSKERRKTSGNDMKVAVNYNSVKWITAASGLVMSGSRTPALFIIRLTRAPAVVISTVKLRVI
jgi:hypothetical protein